MSELIIKLCRGLEDKIRKLTPDLRLENIHLVNIEQTWIEMYPNDDNKAYEGYLKTLLDRIKVYRDLYSDIS